MALRIFTTSSCVITKLGLAAREEKESEQKMKSKSADFCCREQRFLIIAHYLLFAFVETLSFKTAVCGPGANSSLIIGIGVFRNVLFVIAVIGSPTV